MIVWWGPELYFFYNDAYLPLLGTKHPALGKPGDEVWGEIWDIIGPMLGSVLTTGEATWSEDMLLPINRHGYWERPTGPTPTARSTTTADGSPAPSRP